MLILDTDIASAFAKAGHFDALINLFRSVGITTSVYEELLISLEYGYGYPRTIFDMTELITVSEEEQKEYLKIKEKSSNDG